MVRFLSVLAAMTALCVGGVGRVVRAADTPQPTLAFEQAHDKAVAANPAGLVFTLRTKDNRTVFHCGERIPIELVFENHSGVGYKCWALGTQREAVGAIDRFLVDRPKDVVDPHEVTADLHRQRAFTGVWSLPKLGPRPLVGNLNLNDYLSFNRPGVYRLYDTTYRVTTGTASAFDLLADSATIPLVSNLLTIAILPRDPLWEEAVTQGALADYFSNERSVDESYRSVESLEFLRTEAAGMVLLKILESITSIVNAPSQECVAAMADSPYCSHVLEALAKDIKEPEIGITYWLIDGYATVAAANKYRNSSADSHQAWRGGVDEEAFRSQAYGWLRTATAKKRGAARAMSLATLASEQGYSYDEPATRDLMTCFDLLPPDEQFDLLTSGPPYGDDMAMTPALIRIVESAPKTGGWQDKRAKTIALQRLLELDPGRARTIILAEIQKKWPAVGVGPLLRMPGPAPDLDDVLLHNFRLACAGKANLCAQAFLIGRYGSAAIREPIELIYQQRKRGWQIIQYMDRSPPYNEILPPLFAYFYRVDPEFAEAQRSTVSDALLYTEAVMASVGFSPGLEKALIAELHSSDSDTVYNAATALAQYGRAEHKAALFAALRPLGTPVDRSAADLNDALSGLLAEGKLWVLTQTESDLLAKASPLYADSLIDNTGIHTISVGRDTATFLSDRDPTEWVHGLWRVDNCSLDTKAELEEKLPLYPTGTRFSMIVEKKWWREQIFVALGVFLKAHGMSIEEKRGW